MNAMNQFRVITHTFHKSSRTLAAGALALGLALLIGVSSSQAAQTYLWTNTTGAAFNDPGSWSPVGGPGGAADTANVAINGTINTYLTSDFSNIGSLTCGPAATGNALIFTINLNGHTFAGLSANSSSGSGFVSGQQGGGTSTVIFASGTVLVTNIGSATGGRLTAGRNGPGIFFFTNCNVVAGQMVIANGTGAPGSKIVVAGPNGSYSNLSSIAVANAATFGCGLVISNSASLTAMSTFNVGSSAGSGRNFLLVDSNGRVFNRTQDMNVGAAGCSNNTATIQGGGLLDLGGKRLFVGNGGGTAVSNTLRIGTSSLVSNDTFLILTAGNTLDLQGGILWVSTAVTNPGFSSGFGTTIGNTIMAAGTLTPGNGSTVGTLVYSNNLTLLSGSTTIMKLDKGQAGSNDLVTVAGTMTEAGTLTINNVGAPLVGGDTFQLFTAGTTVGNFAVTNLPPLTGTLIWNTSQLGSSGIISVVLPPTITDPAVQAVLAGTDVTISTVATGVPAPALQWQLGGVNLVDGATGNGSTISGSASSVLTILNSQVADSGQYCLIASNFAGAVTNCMTLEVTTTTAAPLINSLHDQIVISPNSATFSAAVAGIPAPTLQWQDNGANILNETNTTLVIPGVTFALDGHQYCLIASNSVGSVTNCALLHVDVPPLVQTQPQNVTVTNTASATFSVVSTNGVPAPTFQWYFNNVAIGGATSSNYTIASVTPANMGNYYVIVVNPVGSATSSNGTLTVNSTMSAALTPANNATAVCYDTPLYLSFSTVPVEKFVGKINIYNVTNPATPIDTIDTSVGLLQSRAVAGDSNGPFNLYPIIITTNVVAIYPHLDVLSSNQTYFVTVDPGTFADTNGALYVGITSTNAWVFTTKPTGPANPNNVTVAYDGSGDFCTVQGALDSLPIGNVTPTLVYVRNGTYTEFVDTKNKNNVTIRGQSRTGTKIQYLNNNTNNGSTHIRMSFKVNSNDIALDNLTLVNLTPQGGSQAETLMLESGALRFILNNAEVDSRQDTILANGAPQSSGYFYNSLVQGNFDYVWGGGDCYFTKDQFLTIPTASSYNLTASRTDTGTAFGSPGVGQWPAWGANQVTSNGLSFVQCQFTRSSSTVSNITLADSNGSANGLASFAFCSFDITNTATVLGYIPPAAGVLSSELVWEFGNSNLNNSASVTFAGDMVLTNGDLRLAAATNAVVWLNGWTPLLSPNIITNPVGATVTAGASVTFSVVATGIPDPTSYQWYKDGNALAGTPSPTYFIPATTGNDNGTYKVVVANDAGSVTSADAILVVNGTAPTASFTANPSTGPEPLAVTFTDTSTGSQPISLAWDFGDGYTATAVGGSSVVHNYAAGTYTVTLVASNYYGTSTLVQPGLIVAVNATFEAWQLAHFGCTNCPAAGPSADPDGDGVINNDEFLAGFDPTNPAAYAHIISVVTQGSDVNVTYLGANGDDTYAGGPASRTNVLEFTTGAVDGSYSNNFVSTGQTNILSGGTGVGVVTNMIDIGGATGATRYYRVRVLAP